MFRTNMRAGAGRPIFGLLMGILGTMSLIFMLIGLAMSEL